MAIKKISKTSELFWLLGIVFVALGVAICSKTNLGVSMIAAPAFIIHDALESVLPWLSVGMTEYFVQGTMILILCLIIRRFHWTYLLAFLVSIIYGYTLDLFLWILSDVSFDTYLSRWIMLIVGDVSTAIGVACFFHTYMPLQVPELFVSEFAKRFTLPINKTKWGFDLSLLAISIGGALILFHDVQTYDWSSIWSISYHNLGLGTLVTTLINSPIIAFVGKGIDQISDPTPLFPQCEKFLKK